MFIWLSVPFVFDDIGDITVKDEAERVECFQGDVLPVLHAMQYVCGNAFFVDQMVFRNIFCEKRSVERRIAYHIITRYQDNTLKMLTMLKILSIMVAGGVAGETGNSGYGGLSV